MLISIIFDRLPLTVGGIISKRARRQEGWHVFLLRLTNLDSRRACYLIDFILVD